MKDKHEAEKYVKQRLEEIRDAPPRNPHMASRGRARFLSQAVSAASLPRQKGWSFKFRKERYAMNVLLSILVIAGLLFGGGATVVGAAQDDLPGEPLYAVKTWSEDVGLQFRYDAEEKALWLMELAQIRIEEMTRLVENGQPVPDQVRVRLEQHIQQALQLCAQMDDPAMERTLLQIRERLKVQVQEMTRLQSRTQQEEQMLPAAQQQMQIMNQTQTMLQQRLEVVDEGLQNREMFREQAQNDFQFGQEEEVTPPVQDGNSQQNGQPDVVPVAPNPAPGGPGSPSPSPNPTPSPSPNPAPGGNGGNGNGLGGGGKP